MWVEHLHPRDEYGRFRLSGLSGSWDRLRGGQANAAHARNMAELKGLWTQQFEHFQPALAAGKLTAEMDAQWDRNVARRDVLEKSLPEAAHRKLTPHDDGTWRDGRRQVFDAEGNRLPEMLLRGAVRVGDRPDGGGVTSDGRAMYGNGVWHMPGEYAPGGVPVLRNDFGHLMGQLMPDDSRSRRDRDHRGAFARTELRSDRRLSGGTESKEFKGRSAGSRRVASGISSSDLQASRVTDPLNPVHRRRTSRKKRDRQQTVTWIQRLNAQMEGR